MLKRVRKSPSESAVIGAGITNGVGVTRPSPSYTRVRSSQSPVVVVSNTGLGPARSSSLSLAVKSAYIRSASEASSDADA